MPGARITRISAPGMNQPGSRSESAGETGEGSGADRELRGWLETIVFSKSLLWGLSSQSSCDRPGRHYQLELPAPRLGRNPNAWFYFSHCTSDGCRPGSLFHSLSRSRRTGFVSAFFPPHCITAQLPDLSCDYLVRSFRALRAPDANLSFPKPPLFFYRENRSFTSTSVPTAFKTIRVKNSRGLNAILAFTIVLKIV